MEIEKKHVKFMFHQLLFL